MYHEPRDDLNKYGFYVGLNQAAEEMGIGTLARTRALKANPLSSPQADMFGRSYVHCYKVLG